jgi:NADPH-dependent 2,4-dienoyl-CoA reductase/sulfur reductase-like enzyme
MSRTPDGNGSLEIHPSPACAESTGPGHAVVIGGSMAGLLAARVLANHCE